MSCLIYMSKTYFVCRSVVEALQMNLQNMYICGEILEILIWTPFFSKAILLMAFFSHK